MRFFTGLHQPSDARHFDAAFLSVNRLRDRKGHFAVNDWIMDSGAFTELFTYGRYRHSVADYANEIARWEECGNMLAAVAQDYMCEPFIIQKTGLSVAEHQRLTITRYDALLACDPGVYILPVLQGYAPEDYTSHIRQYADRLSPGMWIGVGSICKRNSDIGAIEEVLLAIHHERPDLKLHGFGLKSTALSSGLVQELLHTADSMAWSLAARKQGRNGNDWREARSWSDRIKARHFQIPLYIPKAALLASLIAMSAAHAQKPSDTYYPITGVLADFGGAGIPIPPGVACFEKDTIKGGLLQLMQNAGISCGRFHARMDVVFANPAHPNWADLDSNLASMRGWNMTAMLEMDYTPASLQSPNYCKGTNPAYHTMPSNPQAFGVMAAQLVQHVDAKFPGTVTDYEIWNEPDIATSLCTQDGNQLAAYVLLFAATAPQMEAEARLDGEAIRVGGPALAASHYQAPIWVPRLLSDPTTAPYVGFISYHDYTTGDAAITWPELYAETISGVSAGPLFSYVRNLVPPSVPIYDSEFNDDYAFLPDCCRNDAAASPLWLASYYISLLHSNSLPARTVYYASSNPPFCLFGATYGDPTCAYPSAGAPVPQPQYYALSLLFSPQYLNLGSGGTVARAMAAVSPLMVGAFTTPDGNEMLIVNPTATAMTGVNVEFDHTVSTANIFAKVWTMQGGNGIAPYALTPLVPVPLGYQTTVSIPAYSVVGVKL